MITTPLDFLEALSEEILPGRFYQFASDEEQNTLADLAAPDSAPNQPIFFVDDLIPISFAIAQNGKLDITYTVTILLLLTSKPVDAAPLRWPRVVQMIEAGAQLLRALGAHPQVQQARQLNCQVLYNQFDRNADGVALTLEITPADTLTYC